MSSNQVNSLNHHSKHHPALEALISICQVSWNMPFSLSGRNGPYLHLFDHLGGHFLRPNAVRNLLVLFDGSDQLLEKIPHGFLPPFLVFQVPYLLKLIKTDGFCCSLRTLALIPGPSSWLRAPTSDNLVHFGRSSGSKHSPNPSLGKRRNPTWGQCWRVAGLEIAGLEKIHIWGQKVNPKKWG